MQATLWRKLIVNAAINPIASLLDGPNKVRSSCLRLGIHRLQRCASSVRGLTARMRILCWAEDRRWLRVEPALRLHGRRRGVRRRAERARAARLHARGSVARLESLHPVGLSAQRDTTRSERAQELEEEVLRVASNTGANICSMLSDLRRGSR